MQSRRQEGIWWTYLPKQAPCTERNPQQPLLGFIKLELLYTGRNRVGTPAHVPEQMQYHGDAGRRPPRNAT